jgi:hypothetical protein
VIFSPVAAAVAGVGTTVVVDEKVQKADLHVEQGADLDGDLSSGTWKAGLG